jgi:hypothetical protein
MDEHKHHYRRNGLERPWGYAQIGAWMVYVVSILQFCVFIIPTLSPCIASPILSLLFILSIIYVFIYASDTILKNPIDIHLQHHLAQQQQQENHTDGEANGTICKPIVIRNPLYIPPPSLPTSAGSSSKSRSINDRLYYRTNARHLQLYNQHVTTVNNISSSNDASDHRHSSFLPNEAMKQCWICDTTVADHSMHCKFCNKCVYGFDHHCICMYFQC